MPEIRDLLLGSDQDILAMLRAEERADDSAKTAQEARAKVSGIAPKDGGHLTCPGQFSSHADEPASWADYTNYAYPIFDKEHADNAASRWGDASNREGYSSEEQGKIGGRIEAAQRKFGETKDDDKGERAAPVSAFAGLELRGILQVELAEREFFEDFYELTWTFQRVVVNQLRQEQGDPSKIGAYVKDAVAEYGQMVDALVAKALAAGVAGPQDNDAPPGEGADDAMYALGDDDLTLLSGISTMLTTRANQMGGPATERMQAIHDHAAAALGMDCAPDDDAAAEGDEGSADEDATRALSEAITQARTVLAELVTARTEIDAARAIRDDVQTQTTTIATQRDALEAEVKDLEAKRAALLTQGTGRPTQRGGTSVFASLEGRDLHGMSDADLLAALRAETQGTAA